ncbi:MAG: SLBB domain-containing protein [Clostridiales bacterium]|jgi:Na+-translocating ferredoxin:NAD+ oxidoreductase RnfC subunit|nr:SLBB domain-containing protein [Clostridiales bacterium]
MDLPRQIFMGGVVGAGGAGFPTHKKLVKNADLLIVNAAECEPLLCSDKFVMSRFANEIIGALTALKSEMGFKRVVIGTKQKYGAEIKTLRAAISASGADIELFLTKSFYPVGDEQVLIYEITGKTVPPGGIPIALGIVVINVTTALNIYDAIQGKSVTHRYVTVTGEVVNPCVVRAPIGASVSACVEAAGGAALKDFMIVMGGPMMGRQYGKSQLDSLVITKTDGGIIILPDSHCLPAFHAKPLEHIMNQARSVCIQCSYCTDQCPRFLIGHPLHPNRVMRSTATNTNPEMLAEALLCSECGICELHACPMRLSPRQVNIHIKGLLRKNGVKPVFKTNPDQTSMRDYRKIAQSRLIARLDLTQYPTRLNGCVSCEPASVRIPLRQGIGRNSIPAVSVGDIVKAGDVIGRVEFEDVGSVIHASVSGIVTAADANVITIEREESAL